MKRPELIHCTAVFGGGGRFRYSLTREWNTRLDQVCWLMLNPSKATADRDDPTIRRCIDFSFRWGFGGLVVVNLFAKVATYPAELLHDKNAVGPFNDEAIMQASSNRPVICAWGNAFHFGDRVTSVLAMLERNWRRAHCLGLTSWGHPSHPLRLAASKRMKPFRPRKAG
jgi:hypothetical protein